MTTTVLADPYEAPECEHGDLTFASADFKRKATKRRCPTGACQPKSVWVKADRRNPLVPRSTKRSATSTVTAPRSSANSDA